MVAVDAPDTGVGAVLNYNVGYWKFLEVKMALQEWRHWLKGSKQPVVVWTDRKNLAYIQSDK